MLSQQSDDLDAHLDLMQGFAFPPKQELILEEDHSEDEDSFSSTQKKQSFPPAEPTSQLSIEKITQQFAHTLQNNNTNPVQEDDDLSYSQSRISLNRPPNPGSSHDQTLDFQFTRTKPQSKGQDSPMSQPHVQDETKQQDLQGSSEVRDECHTADLIKVEEAVDDLQQRLGTQEQSKTQRKLEKLETSAGLPSISHIFPTESSSPVIKLRKLPSIQEFSGKHRMMQISDNPVAKRNAIQLIHKINLERRQLKKRSLEQMRKLDERVFKHVEESRIRCEQMSVQRKLQHKARIMQRIEKDRQRREQEASKQRESKIFIQRLLKGNNRGMSVAISKKQSEGLLPITPQPNMRKF